MINTILVIIEQLLLHLPLMLGAYVSFSLLKVPDLSIEAAYVVGAIFGSYAVSNSPYLVLVLGASIIGGTLVGLTSSMLTQKGRISHLLSSIITVGLFHGINQLICPPYVSLSATKNPLTVLGGMLHYPELFTLTVIGGAIVCGIYFLLRVQIGYCYAVYGNNPQFFKNYGISTSYVFITGIMCANALAGVSGYLVAQSNNFIELNMGLGKALLCITALIMGKGMVKTKKPFSLCIPLVGTIAYFTVQQLLLKGGFNLKYFTAVQALVVVCIVLYTNRNKPSRLRNDSLGV